MSEIRNTVTEMVINVNEKETTPQLSPLGCGSGRQSIAAARSLCAKNRHPLLKVISYWRLVDPFPYKLRSLCGIGCRTRCRVSQFVALELELPLLISCLPVGE